MVRLFKMFLLKIMVCSVPPLYGFDTSDEDDLDVTPLNHYWLLIKFIMVCPWDIMELFEVQKCTKEAGVIYIKDKNDVEDMGTLSRKDNDKWAFLLGYCSELYFKCFSDWLPKSSEIGRVPYWLETYRIGLFAVKVTNNAVGEKIREACMYQDYSFRTHKFEEFPWKD